MTVFRAPVSDMRFTLDHIAGFDRLAALDTFAEATPDLVAAVLEEIGRLAGEVLAPLNRVGDTQGSVLENGVVRTPEGFKEAYAQFVEGGWNGLSIEPEYGGHGLPFTLSVTMMEMVTAANMGFALCPMLNLGGIEALKQHASEDIKARFFEPAVSGRWTMTMNLTEPQAGSDVGALRTRAEPNGDGRYRISGQKIFITYGDHDMAENILHLVLARTPDAPPGTRGISLFLVPKFHVNDDGSIGEANDLRCVSLEHKLGIHASPTAVMSYGDEGRCIGYLLGEEQKGMRCMFTMMNHARLNVGLQGLAIAERAYQRALAYAIERRQGRAIGAASDGASAIIEHADVRRMLMTMKASIEAMRALVYRNAVAVDLSLHHPDEAVRAREADIAAFLTPISKGFCTDMGCEVTSIGIQVHGGMGYIEETGAAQHFRDARIAPIYEGTNGIQALDLVMRKLPLQGGRIASEIATELREAVAGLKAHDDLADLAMPLHEGLAAFEEAAAWLQGNLSEAPRESAAGATPFLHLCGYAIAGALLARGAVVARQKIEAGENPRYYAARIAIARFFAEQLVPKVRGLWPQVEGGDDILFALDADQLAS